MHTIIKGLVLLSVCGSFAGCKVEKTKDAKMPKVEMHATGGQLPSYHVEGPKVQVGEKTHTIKVPTIHVTTPKDKLAL